MAEPTRPPELRATDRTTLRRHPERGSFDRAAANAVLDEALVAHVGFDAGHGPLVLPMTYGRIGNRLYLHGAVGNAMLRGATSAPVCVTVTLLHGLVLARSAYHHSMNYRCVVLLGVAEKVEDPDEARAALDAIVDHVVPGRTAEARPPSAGELRATLVLRLEIDEGSVKVRAGGPMDEDDDLALGVWAGVVPVAAKLGPPEQDRAQAATSELGDLAPPSPERLIRSGAAS
jgi:uncharacterized protein